MHPQGKKLLQGVVLCLFLGYLLMYLTVQSTSKSSAGLLSTPSSFLFAGSNDREPEPAYVEASPEILAKDLKELDRAHSKYKGSERETEISSKSYKSEPKFAPEPEVSRYVGGESGDGGNREEEGDDSENVDDGNRKQGRLQREDEDIKKAVQVVDTSGEEGDYDEHSLIPKDAEDIWDIRESMSPKTSPWITHDHEIEQRKKSVKMEGTKLIAFYEIPDLVKKSFEGSRRFQSCQYSQCSFTTNFQKADAVLFNGRALLFTPIKKPWPRPPEQRWIFKTVDPVIDDFGLNNDTVRSAFNWTSNYKIDSDIPVYMGKLERKQHIEPVDYVKLFRKKKKVAAWFVSHCQTWSKREEYVERMARIAPVDIYGGCGKLKCGERHNRFKFDLPECFPILTDNYKFYLSFENSFCTDYVSEKLFKTYVSDLQIIPVVRGAVDYHKGFPKGTFIDASDFDSPEDLMRYLIKLGNDEKRYTDMLREKDKWIYNYNNPEDGPWCSMCRKLHSDKTVSHYEDIYKSLTADPNECYSPRDLGPKYLNTPLSEIIAEQPHHMKARG